MGEREIGNTFIFTQTTQPLQTNRDFSAYFKTNIHCTLNSVTTRQSKFIVGDIEENYDFNDNGNDYDDEDGGDGGDDDNNDLIGGDDDDDDDDDKEEIISV